MSDYRSRNRKALGHQGIVLPLLAVVMLIAATLAVAAEPTDLPAQAGASVADPLRQYLHEFPAKPDAPDTPSATLDVEAKAKPAKELKRGVTLDIKGFNFTGLSVVGSQELSSLLQSHLGSRREFAELEAAVGEVADYLRGKGYFLAQAYLPAQKVQDGIVDIAVLEGRIGEVIVESDDTVPVSRSMVDSILSALPPGTVIREGDIERTLFLLGDLRGLTVHSVMQPGKQTGFADLLVKLSPGRQFDYSLDADNMGSEFTGRYRAGASAGWNSPFGRGDNLSARAMFSTDGGLAFGRMSYLLPVGPYGTKLGVAYTHLEYTITAPSFQGLGVNGNANVVSAFLLHPILRGRNLNLFLTMGYDFRDQQDNNQQLAAVSGQNSLLNFNVGNIGLTGDSHDSLLGGGINSFSTTLTTGNLDIASAYQRLLDQSSIGLKTNGSYQKGFLAFTRLQQIAGPFLGFFSISGQVASKNLSSSEKFSLGGPTAVRAYGVGEAPSDEMLLLTGELRSSIPKPQFVPGDFVGSVFIDSAWGRLSRNPLTTTLVNPVDNTQQRTGVGLGLAWGRPEDFMLRGFAAWRLTAPSITGTSTGYPQIYFSLSKFF